MEFTEKRLPNNFIQDIITADLAQGLNGGRVHTRFPPEPNGWLHIGHAIAICLDYGLAIANGGKFNLRFDDTNPLKEEQEFVDAIMDDMRWLGADWEDRLFFASDYFQEKYDFAVGLIKKDLAYVDDLSAEEIREYRGTLTEPGRSSPYRNRPIEESLDLFARMKKGEYPDGAKVLRAKIDMHSPNINMRDPVIYRIRHAYHHRTGMEWCIYPMYDYSHPIGDALEDITHSICTLEYADHRPLYDWVVDNIDYVPRLLGRPKQIEFGRVGVSHTIMSKRKSIGDALEDITHSICTLEYADHRPLYDWVVDNIDYVPRLPGRPKQIEFGRVGVSHTIMSKRKLRKLVEEGFVAGWDDPRMPTIAGLRRRGYTPSSIRTFAEKCGVGRKNMVAELPLLEHCIREEQNAAASRIMAVLRPLKVTLANYPAGQVEWLTIENNPENPASGARQVPFSREIYIEEEDFMENPPKKFHRLTLGGEVRLKGAYIIKCEEVIKDPLTGEVVELICTYDRETKSGEASSGRKVKGTSHWVAASHAQGVTVNLYDTLFSCENPEEVPLGMDFTANINPHSLVTLTMARVEPFAGELTPGERVQFLRQGYFVVDKERDSAGKLVFNRIVGLKDAWAKVQRQSDAVPVE